MTLDVWPGHFDFPEKKDVFLMRFAVPGSFVLGWLLERMVPEHYLFPIELCLGVSLGAVTFLAVDAFPLSNSGFAMGREYPDLRNMLAIILIWSSVISVSLILGSFFGGIPIIGFLVSAVVLAILSSIVPTLCWNLRNLYRTIRK